MVKKRGKLSRYAQQEALMRLRGLATLIFINDLSYLILTNYEPPDQYRPNESYQWKNVFKDVAFEKTV